MTTEEWKLEENGYVSSPSNYFDVGKIQFIGKKDETNIIIGFSGNAVNIDYKTTEKRDELFEWLRAAISLYKERNV